MQALTLRQACSIRHGISTNTTVNIEAFNFLQYLYWYKQDVQSQGLCIYLSSRSQS